MSRPQCPVCGEDTNSYGQPFVSEWAVAAHVAGKIASGGDRLHKSWARQTVPGANLSLSVAKLAQALMWAVHQELEANQSARPTPTPLSLIHDIEVLLHGHIKHRLQAQFCDHDDAWWVEGVPLPIRQECAVRREADPARSEPYAYTYLIDLKSILERNWSLFESDFLRVRKSVSSKREFIDQLVRLNDARNRYSHPVRAPQSDSKAFADDLSLAERVGKIVAEFCKLEP